MAGRSVSPAALAAVGIAVLVGGFTVWFSAETFPYLSANHDEGVYLQQAELLLAGRLELVAGDLAAAVRPWFFVDDGGRLYPKYAPYPAALYATAIAVAGEARLALGVVAAANVVLVYGIGASAFDRRVGLLAAGLFALAPMTILTTAVFLPYAPTTMLLLGFVWGYLRHQRTATRWSALTAGVAIGLAFFARPFTAVLVATPFIVHALWQSLRERRSTEQGWTTPIVRRHAITAAAGAAFVGLTLAYNARMTGSPVVFPYEAFAPLDGIGFGRRAILGHEIDFTLERSIRANAWNLWYLLTRWGPLGAVGSVLAGIGVITTLRRLYRSTWGHGEVARALVLGVMVSVTLGNLAFWGTDNVLGTPTDPTDGLIGLFGPFYHFDLLWVMAIVGAAGLRWTLQRIDAGLGGDGRRWWSTPRHRRALVALVLVVAVLAGGGTGVLLAGPLDRHDAQTDRYATAYEPFENRDLENAVVLVPTPSGPWLNHPFQSLRNAPDLQGDVVYAQAGGPQRPFTLASAYPDRQLYRLAYRGEWGDPGRPLEAELQAITPHHGARFVTTTTIEVPPRVAHATIRLTTDGGDHAVSTIENPGDRLSFDVELSPDRARMPSLTNHSVRLDRTDELRLLVRLVSVDGASRTYRQAIDLRSDDGRMTVLWPPRRQVCDLVDDCGRAGTVLSDEVGPNGSTFAVSIAEATTEADQDG